MIRPNRQARRRRGKSDTADAVAAALAALNGERNRSATVRCRRSAGCFLVCGRAGCAIRGNPALVDVVIRVVSCDRCKPIVDKTRDLLAETFQKKQDGAVKVVFEP